MVDAPTGGPLYGPRVSSKTSARSWYRPTAGVVDGVVAAILALTVVVAGTSGKGASPLAVTAGLVVSAAVAVRRRNPVLTTLVTGAGAGVCSHAQGGQFAALPIAFVLSYYALGRRSAAQGWGVVDAV